MSGGEGGERGWIMFTSHGEAPALRPSPPLSATTPAPTARPDPEVIARSAQARRRHFTVAYKLRILDEAAHTAIGQLGALLRREGLYSSHLANWRRERARGTLTALASPRRGRPAIPAAEREVRQLRVENAGLARKLAAAELVIEVQKKVAALLGLATTAEPTGAVGLPAAASGRTR